MMNKKSSIHHWRIEPANGPRSRGVCLICRATRDFANNVALSSLSDWSKVATGRDNRKDGG